METPKEKAKDIFVKQLEYIPNNLIRNNKDASKLALVHARITVDEILDFQVNMIKRSEEYNRNIHFWEEVKIELEKLKTD